MPTADVSGGKQLQAVVLVETHGFSTEAVKQINVLIFTYQSLQTQTLFKKPLFYIKEPC